MGPGVPLLWRRAAVNWPKSTVKRSFIDRTKNPVPVTGRARNILLGKKAKLCIWCNNKGNTVIFVWTQLSAAGLIALFTLNAPHTKCKYPHILPTNTNRSWLVVVMFCHITLEKFSAFNCTFARGNLPTIDGFPSQRLSDVKLFMFCRACLLLTNCWTKSICRWFETSWRSLDVTAF